MTVYFKPEHFKTSVPVAITSMLVMYTLNQSISAKLPPTSYIKFIDIWLLFGLIQPFFIIVMLVIIEHFPKEKVEHFSTKETKGVHQAIYNFLRVFGKIILPVMEILFIIIYFSKAFMLNNK